MKKTQKAALSILLVLALLTALPLTAMAEAPDYNEPGQEISVEKGETLTTNEGHVVTNEGTITTNQVVAGSPTPRVNAGYIENNTGTVKNNVNGGYIENNQKGAVVEINHGSGTVVVTDENGDTVFEGDAPKTVEAVSTVKNNYGTVKTNKRLLSPPVSKRTTALWKQTPSTAWWEQTPRAALSRTTMVMWALQVIGETRSPRTKVRLQITELTVLLSTVLMALLWRTIPTDPTLDGMTESLITTVVRLYTIQDR